MKDINYALMLIKAHKFEGAKDVLEELLQSDPGKQDRRVASIMIEVNRSLYVDEMTGAKTSTFDSTKKEIQTILVSIREF